MSLKKKKQNDTDKNASPSGDSLYHREHFNSTGTLSVPVSKVSFN